MERRKREGDVWGLETGGGNFHIYPFFILSHRQTRHVLKFLHECLKNMVLFLGSSKQWGMVLCWTGNGLSQSNPLSSPLHQPGPTLLHCQMVIGKREDNTASCAMLSNANVPILEDASACLASLQADSTSHFGLLMENLEKIEEIFDDSDVVRLERDILIQIGRLGALKIFHACLSRTVKAPDAPQQAFPLTETSKNSPEDTPVYDHMNNITVRSRKKRERKSRRERVTEKAAKMSALSPSSKAIRDFQQLPTNPSNSRGRRHSIVRNESEMSRGVKEIANLEKVRMSLEERIGRAASLSRWAHAAGMDVKVLQQRLHFGRYCRDKLLKSTRSLVLYIARNYRGRGLGLEDLLQAGNMGVLQGAERFDHTRGYQFSTYVQYWVRKSMSALIARHSRGVRIPVTLNNVINKTQKARRAFYDHHGRYPQDEEIAKLTGTSLTNVRLANKCSRVMGSTDQKVGDCIGVKFMPCAGNHTRYVS
ncbi:RNA polymerase sigma factor sigC isoform X5 [Magnolia sinica]|uniref:RNA polymerase sigma factor sigC isoform X5 n=1 Tax=Magnolia sinica TaxID=86752 RepID=UPI00265A1553|nr:RNA polymerase sigma factor sigC isoform X5 [Magnolia sinica]